MPHPSTLTRRALRATVAGALLAGALLVAAVDTTSAKGDSALTVTMRDNCDAASFNAAVGPGTCVGDGNTTFDEFLAALPPGHPKWRNQVGSGELKVGQAISVVNRGGEFHSFTEVSQFGGGIVDILNQIGGFTEPAVPVGPFDPATALVPPGGKETISMLAPGTHMFQCMIHPWMRSTITVKRR